MSSKETGEEERAGFGGFGGRYVPEALWNPLEEVRQAFEKAVADESFVALEEQTLIGRGGRATPLCPLPELSRRGGGAQLWAKREDLGPGGSFSATSAISQALLASRMGRTRLLTESATGDFGVALAMAGAALGMEVTVFMSRDDLERESFNAARMQKLGAKVVPVAASTSGRRQAMAEALRTFSLTFEQAFYATSSLASPDPYPRILGRALSVIGRECREQLSRAGLEAEYVVAPVGSGSFAAGLFAPFVDQSEAQLVGVQAGGDDGSGRGAASLVFGSPGVYLGTRSMLLQGEGGQIDSAHTAAAGLAMPIAGPQHARWLQQGRVHYVTVSDEEAGQARDLLTRKEGVLASRESGYPMAYALKLASTLRTDQHIVVGISSSGIRHLGEAILRKAEANTP